jgi:hypothetical protein
MYLNELFTEALMSATVQTRAPQSPGARGLAAGRFNFIKSRDAASGDNAVSAVEILKIRLIDSKDVEEISNIVTSVAAQQNVTTEQLVRGFKSRYGSEPRQWLRKYMTSYLKSPKGMVHESSDKKSL